MEKTEIQNRLSDVKNTVDLLRLINDVLASIYPSNHRKITIRQLNYFANVQGVYTRYTQFNIPKNPVVYEPFPPQTKLSNTYCEV